MRSSLRQGPRYHLRAWLLAATCLVVVAPPLILAHSAIGATQDASGADRAWDIYYKTKDQIAGQPAPHLTSANYPTQFGESRLVVWIVAQQYLYWGALVSGGLLLVTLLEISGLLGGFSAAGVQNDRWAYGILRLVIGGFSIAALLGAGLTACLLVLYPDLTSYLIQIFRPTVLLYIVLALVLTATAYVYYYTWGMWSRSTLKFLHASIGVLANAVATTMVLLANGWSSFMLSPAGVDQYGRFLGNIWHSLHTATWNSFNVHRVLSHLILAAGVFASYAAYQALTAKTSDERAGADRQTYWCLLVLALAFFMFPFQGYWLQRDIYAYRQQMGITLLGGLLAWLGILRVILVGLFFFGLNYYLWQRISTTSGGSPYDRFRKYVFLILTLCVTVYITPHTMIMTPRELLEMEGQQHPVLGNYGVEPAKQAAVNMMILVTIGSWYLWNRARAALNSRQVRLAGPVTMGIFLGAALNLLWLSVYGYYIPANVRVGISVASAATPLMVMGYVLVVTRCWQIHGDRVRPEWGKLPTKAYWAVFALAFFVTWFMGLGGYLRSSVRLFWHVNEMIRDESPWAFTHSVGFAANVISLNALLFWCGVLVLFWLDRLRERESAHHMSATVSAVDFGLEESGGRR